jgi:hypothetical protein
MNNPKKFNNGQIKIYYINDEISHQGKMQNSIEGCKIIPIVNTS